MKRKRNWALSRGVRKARYPRLTTLGLERTSTPAERTAGTIPRQRRWRRRGLTTLSLSPRRHAGDATVHGPSRTRSTQSPVPRIWRTGLTTLALSGRVSAFPTPLFSTEPQITETTIWLSRLDSSHDGLRIVQLSDIHHSLYTSLGDIEHAVYLANRLRPDVVALTGDYVTLSSDCIWPVARALGKLRAPLGVFAVLGNHDFQVDAGLMTRALQAHGIDVLRNSHRVLLESLKRPRTSSRSATLWIAGIDDLWWRADDLRAAIRAIPAQEPKILLCHNPLGIRQAARRGIDFVLSGHTHGGQVRLPVVRSLYRSKLGERFIEGWNRLDGTQIYVNRGIGKVLLPLRIDCPPEIACLRLRSANGSER